MITLSSDNMRLMSMDLPRHFLRAWRKHVGITQTEAVERGRALFEDRVVAEGEEASLKRIGLSQPSLARIEKGETPYNQTLLEILAEVYGTDVPSLIMRNPADPEGIWSIYDQIPVQERPRALKVISGVVEGFKTGTDG